MFSSVRHFERWPLLLAVALAAMTIGHSVELAIEHAGLFGDGRASYGHAAQGPALTVALALIILGLIALVFRISRAPRIRDASADWVLPGLDAIRSMGFAASAVRIALIQFPALLTTELVEQRLSGFAHPSVAAIFGPGHVTAPFVQIVACAVAAWALVKIAAAVCAHVSDVVRAARFVIDNFVAAPQRAAERCAVRAALAFDFGRPARPAPLALRVANRPPPAIAAARA